MGDDPYKLIFGVSQLQFSDFDCFLFIEIKFLEKFDLILFLPQSGLRKIVYRVVPVTFEFIFLYNTAEHKYCLDFVLLDHSPEVVKGCFGKGSLSGYRPFSFDIYKVGVDVVIYMIFLGRLSQQNSSWLKGHVFGISVQLELLWVFV